MRTRLILLATLLTLVGPASVSGQPVVTYLKPHAPGERVALFRGHTADLDVTTAPMVVLRVFIRSGGTLSDIPLPGATVEVVDALSPTRHILRVRSAAPHTPRGDATIWLLGPAGDPINPSIPVHFFDIGTITDIQISAQPTTPLGEAMTVTLEGEGLGNVLFCGLQPTSFGPMSPGGASSSDSSVRTETQVEFRVTPQVVGPIAIGTNDFKPAGLGFCSGDAVPWGSPSVQARTTVIPNPRPTTVDPQRTRPGDIVRIVGAGLFEQTNAYQIGVTFRGTNVPATHPGATGGPIPVQRAPGDAVEFQVPPQMRDAQLELSYTTSRPIGSFRVPVPGVLRVDAPPVLEEIRGADTNGLFVPGGVIEIRGSDLLDRDGPTATRVLLGVRELNPSASSQGYDGTRLLVAVPDDTEPYTGPLRVEHAGGQSALSTDLTVAARPRLEEMDVARDLVTWCEAGQPRAQNSGDFRPHPYDQVGTLIGHTHRVRGRHMGSIAGVPPRLLLDGAPLAGVSFEGDQATFTVPFGTPNGHTELVFETAAGADTLRIELVRPLALNRVESAVLFRGTPPEPTDVVVAGDTDPATPGSDYVGEILVEGWPGPGCGLDFAQLGFGPAAYQSSTATVHVVGGRFYVRTQNQVTRPTTASLRISNVAPGSPTLVPLTVLPHPPEPSAVTLEHAAVVGGNEVDVQVQLAHTSSNDALNVTASDPSAVTVPATVPASLPTITFPVRTHRVDAPRTVTITVAGPEVTVTAELRVGPQPIRMQEVLMEPQSALGGAILQGVVRMSGMTAQTAPIQVTLSSENRELTFPPTVTVTAGTGRFEVRSDPVSRPTKAAILARSAHGEAVGAFNLRPLEVSAVRVEPTSIRPGQDFTLLVELAGPAPTELPLEIMFSDEALSLGARSPVVPVGAASLQVPISAGRDANPGVVTIEVLLPGQNRGEGATAQVTIVG